MKHLKVGDVCILDENNEKNLKSYNHPVIVKLIKKIGFGTFVAVNVSESEEYVYKNHFTTPSGKLIVRKNELTKIDQNTKIVVRNNINTPLITDDDITTMETILQSLTSGKGVTLEEINFLSYLTHKLKIYKV